MVDVLITCPKTNEVVRTVFEMDPAAFRSGSMSGNAFGCSACGETHVWDSADAFFDS